MPSRLAQLTRAGRAPAVAGPAPRADASERCDLCGEPVAPDHRHLVDVDSRRLLCACRACTLLFDRAAAGGGHLKLLPTRRRRLDDFQLDDAAWARLRIPVELAFFFPSTPAARVVALYPGPLGATESLLELEAWSELEAANPPLRELEPDVEALLVCRAHGMREHWTVPIDDCYELVAVIRTRWKGFGGGEEVWQAIGRFFDDLAPQGGETMVMRIGRADVEQDASAHTPGIRQGNAPGAYERERGHLGDGRVTARRSTGVDPKGREPIDDRMPNLPPG